MKYNFNIYYFHLFLEMNILGTSMMKSRTRSPCSYNLRQNILKLRNFATILKIGKKQKGSSIRFIEATNRTFLSSCKLKPFVNVEEQKEEEGKRGRKNERSVKRKGEGASKTDKRGDDKTRWIEIAIN